MRVKTGLEILLDSKLHILRNRRVGIIINPASVNDRLQSTIHLFSKHPDIELVAIFGPQHGTRGETQDNMIEWENFRDSELGIPVYSLYGETRKPTEEMLAGLDTLVFDLQDIGTRYYTFIHTLALAMEACAEFDKEMVVLDRPNPLNGNDIEGPVLSMEFRSFVGLYPLPIRHGMTIGEIAIYLKKEFSIECPLEIIRMQDWKREHYFDNCGLPWVMPSPNMPTLDTAIVYPGMCLLEGTNISEGRGTTRPFEMCGAPWIEPDTFSESLNSLEIPGIHFRPIHFEPTFHKWSDVIVGGVHLHVLDRTVLPSFLTGLAVIDGFHRFPGSKFRYNNPPYEYEYDKLPFDILCGTDQIRIQLEEGKSLKDIQNTWKTELEDFAEIRQRYLLY